MDSEQQDHKGLETLGVIDWFNNSSFFMMNNSGWWSEETRNWDAVGAVSLNPDRIPEAA